MACGLTAFGQFIPQPNAYNPDANGDAFIGVDDVMGTLALFGNAFQNSDSLNIVVADPDMWNTWQDTGQGSNGQLEVPIGTDLIYLKFGAYPNDAFETRLTLPNEIGFKVLTVFWDATPISNAVNRQQAQSDQQFNRA